jgi:hypothetical protein
MYSRWYATTARLPDISGPFLPNGSVNTFPQQDTNATMIQQQRTGVFYVAHAEVLQARNKVRP